MNSLKAPCIKCGDGPVRLDIEDGETLYCAGCEAEYTVADVEETMAAWGKLMKWIKACPSRE